MGHQVVAQEDASPMELRVLARLASARLDAIRLGGECPDNVMYYLGSDIVG